ncbi:uncharacterized protein SCHCODRAFT_02571890 [Schizophyllum commune H4-8]|nr:uncharacterized protein SCHCODRAFT_02571890 [Schizophyllum commune H4-8]KAI5894949.1 hypothetical protein SCHCODRAFT_02571890 [Schizophyllum commune H4-8]
MASPSDNYVGFRYRCILVPDFISDDALRGQHILFTNELAPSIQDAVVAGLRDSEESSRSNQAPSPHFVFRYPPGPLHPGDVEYAGTVKEWIAVGKRPAMEHFQRQAEEHARTPMIDSSDRPEAMDTPPEVTINRIPALNNDPEAMRSHPEDMFYRPEGMTNPSKVMVNDPPATPSYAAAPTPSTQSNGKPATQPRACPRPEITVKREATDSDMDISDDEEVDQLAEDEEMDQLADDNEVDQFAGNRKIDQRASTVDELAGDNTCDRPAGDTAENVAGAELADEDKESQDDGFTGKIEEIERFAQELEAKLEPADDSMPPPPPRIVVPLPPPMEDTQQDANMYDLDATTLQYPDDILQYPDDVQQDAGATQQDISSTDDLDGMTLRYPDEEPPTPESPEPALLSEGPLYRFADESYPFKVVVYHKGRTDFIVEDLTPKVENAHGAGLASTSQVKQRPITVNNPPLFPSSTGKKFSHIPPWSAYSTPRLPSDYPRRASVSSHPPVSQRARFSAAPYPPPTTSPSSSKPCSSASTGSCASVPSTVSCASAPSTTTEGPMHIKWKASPSPRAHTPTFEHYNSRGGKKWEHIPGLDPLVHESRPCPWPVRVPFDTTGSKPLTARDVLTALACDASIPDTAQATDKYPTSTDLFPRCGAPVRPTKTAILKHIHKDHGVDIKADEFFCPICVCRSTIEAMQSRPVGYYRLYKYKGAAPEVLDEALPEAKPPKGLKNSSVSNHMGTLEHLNGRYTCALCGPHHEWRDSTGYWAHVHAVHVKILKGDE